MRADMLKLSRCPYNVSAKADGVRMFLLFSFTDTADYSVFIDRAGTITPLTIVMPLDVHSGTLLDGEYITHPDGTHTYLVFDCIAANGYCMVHKSHSERVTEVVRTVVSVISLQGGLTLKAKRWFPLASANLNDVLASVEAPTDGLIFVPEHGNSLHPGQQTDHFKWKVACDHTIDMIWRGSELWVHKFGAPEKASLCLGVTEVLPGGVVAPEGCVVECRMTPRDSTTWVARFVRIRDDKTTPNDLRVAKLTLQNIFENITLDELQ